MIDRAPIVAFLGPSLDRERALALLSPKGIVLPPATAGDLIRALRLRPRAIVLLDGRFDDVPSPWHKELLLAMEMGVHVFGGASMGALRAVECERFGAQAIGRIAASYRSGRREDDAVAIAHLPAAGGWRPVSTALVDIEAVIESSMAEGTVSRERGRELAREARETPFPRRVIPAELHASEIEPGLKERDAILTCREAAKTEGVRNPGPRVPRTTWLLRLARLALGSPFPACAELPEVEQRFRAAVDSAPWLGPLFSDAITFGAVQTPLDRSSPLSNERRDALSRYHLERVPDAGSWRSLGTRMAASITDHQIGILETIGEIAPGDGLNDLLAPDRGSGVRDDALARLVRSEGLPPVHDALLETNPGQLAGTIDSYLQCGSPSMSQE